MSNTSVQYSTIRILFIAGLLQGIGVGCDLRSPTDPHGMLISGDLTYVVVPSGLTATAVSWSAIDVSWPKSSNAATGYDVFRSTTGSTGTYTLAGSTTSAVSRYGDAGLTAATQYCYEIRSFKTAGKNTTYSSFSSAACATTLPPPVAAPSATDATPAGSSIVRVSWADNSSNEDGFHIEQADVAGGPWTRVGTAAANTTSFSQPATQEQQACYRVIAFNGIGPSFPSASDCTTPPAGPTKLVASPVDQKFIDLTWADNSGVEDGYRVSRLDAAGIWADIATLPPKSVAYRDGSANLTGKNTYRVQALKDGGNSDYSNEATAQFGIDVVIPPAAPFNAVLTFSEDIAFGWLFLDVAWADASTNEDGFLVEYSMDRGNAWNTYTTTPANVPNMEEKLDLWSASPLSMCFRVLAYNGATKSDASNAACADWAEYPTNVTATAVDQQRIDLSWTENANFENGYLVFRSTTIDGEYAQVAELPKNTTGFRDEGLLSGQEYWYFVVVDEAAGTNDIYNYSDYVSATTLSSASSVQSRSIVTGQGTSQRVKRNVRRLPRIRRGR